jgi:hypothetical protein
MDGQQATTPSGKLGVRKKSFNLIKKQSLVRRHPNAKD